MLQYYIFLSAKWNAVFWYMCLYALKWFESCLISFVFSSRSPPAEWWCSSELCGRLLQDMWVSKFIRCFWLCFELPIWGMIALLPGSGWVYWLNVWECGLCRGWRLSLLLAYHISKNPLLCQFVPKSSVDMFRGHNSSDRRNIWWKKS